METLMSTATSPVFAAVGVRSDVALEVSEALMAVGYRPAADVDGPPSVVVVADALPEVEAELLSADMMRQARAVVEASPRPGGRVVLSGPSEVAVEGDPELRQWFMSGIESLRAELGLSSVVLVLSSSDAPTAADLADAAAGVPPASALSVGDPSADVDVYTFPVAASAGERQEGAEHDDGSGDAGQWSGRDAAVGDDRPVDVLETRRGELADVVAAITNRRDELARLAGDVEAAARELQGASEQLARTRGELESARSEADVTRNELVELGSALVSARQVITEGDRAAVELAQALARLDSARSESDALARQRDEAAEALARLTEDETEVRTRLDELAVEVVNVSADLAAAQSAASAAAVEREAAESDLSRVNEQVAEAAAALDLTRAEADQVRAEASADAAAVAAQAARDAADRFSRASTEAEELLAAARAEAAATRTAAGERLEGAEREAEDIVAAARQKAESDALSLRAAATGEAEDIVAAARDEASRLSAEARRLRDAVVREAELSAEGMLAEAESRLAAAAAAEARARAVVAGIVGAAHVETERLISAAVAEVAAAGPSAAAEAGDLSGEVVTSGDDDDVQPMSVDGSVYVGLALPAYEPTFVGGVTSTDEPVSVSEEAAVVDSLEDALDDGDVAVDAANDGRDADDDFEGGLPPVVGDELAGDSTPGVVETFVEDDSFGFGSAVNHDDEPDGDLATQEPAAGAVDGGVDGESGNVVNGEAWGTPPLEVEVDGEPEDRWNEFWGSESDEAKKKWWKR
jgi:uncharacterized coiled-coil DUF342 family protein